MSQWPKHCDPDDSHCRPTSECSAQEQDQQQKQWTDQVYLLLLCQEESQN